MALRNLTITIDPETARWARVAAAERDMSVARFVGEILREKMDHERSYEAAMHDFLSYEPRALKAAEEHYPQRDEVHDRSSLR